MHRKWLISYRLAKGLKQGQAAASIGISRPYYLQIEHGDRDINLRLAKQISIALDIPWQAFFDND